MSMSDEIQFDGCRGCGKMIKANPKTGKAGYCRNCEQCVSDQDSAPEYEEEEER